MPHHHSKNVESFTSWCNTCKRMTQHKVSCGRLGHCLEHAPKEKPAKPEKKQTDLFK